MGNHQAGQKCTLCNTGEGVFREIQNNFVDPPGKQFNPDSNNNDTFIQRNQQLATQSQVIDDNIKSGKKKKKKELPRVKEEHVSEEFKQFLIPNNDIEDSADFLAIDG